MVKMCIIELKNNTLKKRIENIQGFKIPDCL